MDKQLDEYWKSDKNAAEAKEPAKEKADAPKKEEAKK